MTEINFLNILQVLVAVALILFILIQRGPGATAGSAFGGGASGTVFGAKGTGSFLTKTTAILATAFFIITMLIAVDASERFAGSAGGDAATDLGVIGTLDDEDSEPTIVPDDGVEAQIPEDGTVDEALDAAAEQMDEAKEAVTETAEDVKEATVDAAEEVTDQLNEETEASDDDGDN